MSRTITLGRNAEFETIVDDCDYEYLSKNLWTYKRSSARYKYAVYARRCIRVKGKKTTLLMAHEILEKLMGKPRPSKRHSSDHINNDPLDNRRCNLRWATKRQQSRNQRRYKTTAESYEQIAA